MGIRRLLRLLAEAAQSAPEPVVIDSEDYYTVEQILQLLGVSRTHFTNKIAREFTPVRKNISGGRGRPRLYYPADVVDEFALSYEKLRPGGARSPRSRFLGTDLAAPDKPIEPGFVTTSQRRSPPATMRKKQFILRVLRSIPAAKDAGVLTSEILQKARQMRGNFPRAYAQQVHVLDALHWLVDDGRLSREFVGPRAGQAGRGPLGLRWRLL